MDLIIVWYNDMLDHKLQLKLEFLRQLLNGCVWPNVCSSGGCNPKLALNHLTSHCTRLCSNLTRNWLILQGFFFFNATLCFIDNKIIK